MKKKHPKKEGFRDIRSRTEQTKRRDTVSLRRHRVGLEVDGWRLAIGEEQVVRFVRGHKRPLGISAAAAIMLVIAVIFIQRGHAETATLYPASCLGGWKNVSNAAGKPATTAGDSGSIDESNSAALVNTQAEMYCGSFTGDMPSGTTTPTTVTLVPYWRITDAPLSAELPVENSPPAQEELPASSTETVPPPTDTPPSDATPPAELLPPSPPDSSSFLRTFAPFARAQEENVSSTETIAPQPTDASSSTATDTPPVVMDADPDVVQLKYTLDGETWNVLGTAKRSNWQNARFTLPVTDPTWDEIQKMQISVVPVASLDTPPAIYIDGFILQVDYKSAIPPPVLPDAPIDPTTLHFSEIKSSGFASDTLPLAAVEPNGEGVEKLVVSGLPAGNLHIFKLGDTTFSFALGVGDAAIEFQAYDFTPGSYAAVLTADPGGCADVDMATCQESSNTQGTVSFIVSIQTSPPPASVTSTPSE